jgi:hypothetical protein
MPDNANSVPRYRSLATAFSAQIVRFLSIAAFRLCATAGICLATAGATLAEGANVWSPLCVEADLRLITLIEAHGEAQDVAADLLAQAFFTVVEARKACSRGQVESAMTLYKSIPLPPLTSFGQ